MATKNPRVVGYIDPEDHAKLQRFMKDYGVTESKAIALILHSFFTGEAVSTETSRVNEALSNTPELTQVVKELAQRVEHLEAHLGKRRAA